MTKLETLAELESFIAVVVFVRANPDLSWPELARKSNRVDWMLRLLARCDEPGFSLGKTSLDRQRNMVRFAYCCVLPTLPKFEKCYPTDERPRQAIEAGKKWAENPTEENRAAARILADDSSSASISTFVDVYAKDTTDHDTLFPAAVTAIAASTVARIATYSSDDFINITDETINATRYGREVEWWKRQKTSPSDAASRATGITERKGHYSQMGELLRLATGNYA